MYVLKGTTKITILSSDSSVNHLEVKGSEGAFAPVSHFHNIENIGKDEAEIMVAVASPVKLIKMINF